MNITNLLYIILCLFFFTVGVVSGQELIDHTNFSNKIAKDVSVVEFWVEWNSANEFADITKLKECNIYRVDIASCRKLPGKYDIVGVPTVLVFENREERERFNPNIMFQLEADKKTVQHSIDTIILNKFQ